MLNLPVDSELWHAKRLSRRPSSPEKRQEADESAKGIKRIFLAGHLAGWRLSAAAKRRGWEGSLASVPEAGILICGFFLYVLSYRICSAWGLPREHAIAR